MIRRIMQIEIHEERPDQHGEVLIEIRDPRTGKVVYNLVDDPKYWVPND